MEIHIQLAGISLGPYSEKQVREYIADGLLSTNDKARIDGTIHWMPVSELMEKMPAPADPPPPADPDAIFIDEETPAEAEPPEAEEPKRAPEAAPGVTHLPSRVVDSKKVSLPAVVEALSGKNRAFGPTAPSNPPKGLSSSKNVNTTAPLAQSTKKMSRTALAKALQNRTEPLPSRAGSVSSPMPPKMTPPAVPVGAPDTTGPMAPDAPVPAQDGNTAKLPSLIKALTAKTVPLRQSQTTSPTPNMPPASAPPVPGGRSTLPITAPLPTKAIINPAVVRAPRPPSAPPLDDDGAATEKLPISKKAAELRAQAARQKPAETVPETTPEPEESALPRDEPATTPRRRSRVFLYVVALLALLGLYYIWSPYHASSVLRDAMAVGNPSELERQVDFPAVRDGLKSQVREMAANSGGNAPVSAEAAAMLTNAIDLYVTPAGINALTSHGGTLPVDKAGQALSPDVAAGIVSGFVNEPVRTQGLTGPTSFVMQTDVAALTLAWHGLTWKLEHIDVRPDVMTGTGPVSALLVPVVQTYLNRGQAASGDNDWKTAIDNDSLALAIDPNSSTAYNLRGEARQASGDPEGAIKDFSRALSIDPQLATALRGRGNARASRNDYDGAIADFTQAIKMDPTLAAAYDSRGNAKASKDDLDGAIADFTNAIAIDPNLASAYSDRGFARQANGNLDGAISDYNQAILLKPNSAVAYYHRGLARQSQGNFQPAIVDYDRALAFDPRNAKTYYSRANAKYAIHDTDGAISDYTQAIALDPKLPLAYCDRGLAREAKGDLDGAVADYTQALALDPRIADAYYNRGLIEARRGQLDAAIADSSQALDLDPRNAQAYYNRGFAKLVRGNFDGATTDLKAFCDAAPRDRFADNARLYLWLVAKLQGAHLDADQDLSDALENNWNTPTDDFTAKTAAFLLGRMTESDYLGAANSTDAATDANQHCQAWYFAGMKRLLMGDKATAMDDFKQCVATGKTDFCEYILAKSELQSPTLPAPVSPPPPPPPVLPPQVNPGALRSL